MSSTTKTKDGKDIIVPQFSVYPVYGKNSFSVKLDARGVTREYGVIYIEFNRTLDRDYNPKLSQILTSHLVRSFKFGNREIRNWWTDENDAGTSYQIKDPEFKLSKRYDLELDEHKALEISSEFNGFIPQETKERMKELNLFMFLIPLILKYLNRIWIKNQTKKFDYYMWEDLRRKKVLKN